MAEKPSIKTGMKEAFAVTGYISTKGAQELESGSAGTIDIQVERGSDEVVMRVDRAGVAELRMGATVKNHTLVQAILRDDATVETIIKTQASVKGVARFSDPILQRLTASATAKSIAV